MALDASFTNRARAMALVATAMSGCLLVSPLGEFEPAADSSSGGTSARGGSDAEGGAEQGGTGSPGGSASGGMSGAGAEAGTGGGDGECTTNEDCLAVLDVLDAEKDPVRCRPSDHTCKKLKSEGCFLAYGDSTDDDAIFLGAFASFLDRENPADNPTVYPLRLAIDEINTPEDRPLPGLNGRSLVVTVCDNASERGIDDAMTHLVEEVEVPAVLATLKPADLMRAFSKHDDIFYLSPVGRTSAVTELDHAHDPDTRSIWNLLGVPSDYADAYVELVRRVEQYVRYRENRLNDGSKLKLALVVDRNVDQTAELGEKLESVLELNGLLASENGDDLFRVVPLTTGSDGITAVVEDLTAFGPDIVVSAAGPRFNQAGGILLKLDEGTPPPAGPFYVVSPYDASDLDAVRDRIRQFIAAGSATDLNQRVVSVSIAPPTNRDLLNEYAIRLGQRYPPSKYPAADRDTGNYYDALYYLAYAAYAAGQSEPLTGKRMAEGFLRLIDPSGKPRDVGPSNTASILQLLDNPDEQLALETTLGPPKFEDGHRQVDASISCLSVSDPTVTELRDVLVYDRDVGEFKASGDDGFPCFPRFF